MAAIKRHIMQIAATREKIQTTQLVKRLQEHALGAIKMTASQIRAAEILLRKSVPDLMRTEVTGADGGAVEHQHYRMDVPREESREEWLARVEAAARATAPSDPSDLVH